MNYQPGLIVSMILVTIASKQQSIRSYLQFVNAIHFVIFYDFGKILMVLKG